MVVTVEAGSVCLSVSENNEDDKKWYQNRGLPMAL